MEAGLGPFPYGLEDYAAVYERLREVSAGGAEGVGADYEGARGFVAFEEGECFGGGKKGEEFRGEEGAVAVVETYIVCQPRHERGARVRGCAEEGWGGEDPDCIGKAAAQELEVGR